MSEFGDRKIAGLLGLLGALLLGLEGLLDLIRGAVYLAVRHGVGSFATFDQALILIVVAIVIAAFAVLGAVHREGRAVVAGAVLIVIAIVGWLELGFGSGVLALLGALLTLLGGVVFLVSSR